MFDGLDEKRIKEIDALALKERLAQGFDKDKKYVRAPVKYTSFGNANPY